MVLYTLHLFAGAGGGILGDILLGHRAIGAVEIEDYPRKVLLARQLDGSLPGFPIWDDVRTFRADNPETASYIQRLRQRENLCISGGFPCQDISSAGKGAGITGERSGLWAEFSRIIGEVRPRYVFVENSPLLVSRGLDVVLSDLAAMGYNAAWGVVGAHHVGAPHKRDRIWIVAHAEWDKRCWTLRRSTIGMGRINKYIPWNESPECALSQLRGVDDGVAGAVDRTNCIRNRQVPAVAALAWTILSEQLGKE